MLTGKQYEILPEYARKQYGITAALWGEDEGLDDAPVAKLVIFLANALLVIRGLEALLRLEGVEPPCDPESYASLGDE